MKCLVTWLIAMLFPLTGASGGAWAQPRQATVWAFVVVRLLTTSEVVSRKFVVRTREACESARYDIHEAAEGDNQKLFIGRCHEEFPDGSRAAGPST